jgi:putative peptidoglycan lipid II flippase
MILNIVLNFLFIYPLRNGGPALATSLSAVFNAGALFIIFRRRYGAFGMMDVFRSVAKFTAGAITVAVVCYVLIHWDGFYAGRLSQKVVALGLTIGAATGAYFLLAMLLRFRELTELRVARGEVAHDEATV